MRAIFKTLLMLILIFVGLNARVFSQELAGYKKFFKIVSQTPQGITISFEFPELEIRDAGSASASTKVFEIPGLSFNYVQERPLLPVLSLPLSLPEGKMSPVLTVEKTESFPGLFPAEFNDRPNNPDDAQSSRFQEERKAGAEAKAYRSLYPEQIFELEAMGIFRDYQLSALRVYPLQVSAGGVKFYKKFTVTITFHNVKLLSASVPFAESRLLQNFVANKEQLHLVSPQSPALSGAPPASAPQFSAGSSDSRVKIILDQHGIYRVTGKDLKDAGVNIADIIPSTLRLSNKGREVAFFLTGGHDNSFDEEDSFEFWGERNEKTFLQQYPDQYADPFSDENVYWLEWGGSGGLRMVQENGSLVTNQTGQYNPSFYYSATVHVEENRRFERLGEGSPEQLSYTRDLWYFDAGIKAVGKKQYPFELLHPQTASFRPVYATVMFSGLSLGQHNVMVWLNNGFVGTAPSNWFSQDTARISNLSNSSLRTTDLNHGENILEVQLPTLPANQTDIVLLNWFDVTYDRLYKAHKNQIEFKRPAFIPYPNTDLFQFDIDNFRRQDIEIYKKGVSKIVNYRIEAELVNDTTIYQISFQDNVSSDDIEYIAITTDKKKRPLRIEKDKPFDPQMPERSLHDVNNAAEYIIITHNRFYDNARVLQDYRRSQGLAVELVDVQDIYDEFNYGIKSPLAVREFLRYAFFNWNRNPRLKYVLLLGDANFDYKSKSAVAPDFVPTFFYQTQEFGAAASDFPYALISGADEIPDLFVGRIPVNTNSEVHSVVQKIIEYETSTPANAWRNQALFISGNDAITNELNTSNPAFRSQNSRVIESILPRNLSAIRLHTVQDTSLHPFDPNFGSRSDLRDHFDDGLFYVNFMGHGGGGIWADVQLMNLADVDNLNNKGMYPFVTSMTCFTGAFENPNRMGLAQKMVLAPERGAIGVFASSGLGYLHNDYAILWNIGQFMFDRSLTIGEMITLGKILYWSKGANYGLINGNSTFTPGYYQVRHEMVYQYNLIGDPYVKLQFSENNISVTPSTVTPQRGDAIDVTINSNLFAADGYLELVDYKFDLVDRLPLFGVSQTTTLTLTIPQDFPDGTGLIRVFLSDGSQYGSGQAAIGINHAVLTSVEFEPPDPAVDDTVYINLRVQDLHGVNRVYLFRETNTDTIFAAQNPNDTAMYIAKMEPTFQLQTVPFEVHVQNNVGNTSVFRNLSYVVTDTRPDVSPVPGSLQFTGVRKTQLKVGIQNLAGAGIDNLVKVNAYFADGADNFANGVYFTSGQVQLSSTDSTSLAVDFPLALNRVKYNIYVRVEVDPSEDVQDFNPANDSLNQILNPTIFNVTPAGSDTIIMAAYRVHFPPGSVSDSSAVRIQLQEFPKPQDQAALIPVPVVAPEKYHSLQVGLLNPQATQSAPFNLIVNLDPALLDTSRYFIEDVTLYEKINDNQPWTSTLFSGDAATNSINSYPQKSARYAPFVSFDGNAPRIELTVDGRPLQQSGLVSENPSLYLIVQDESGINLQKDKITITLNGNFIPEDKIFIPDSVQKNNVLGITINPNLTIGEHNLSVAIQDVNGNSSTKEFKLVVSNEFDIIVYGNYPNPFQEQTIFAYFVNLNDDLDEFEIRIYTVSGRLIRKIDSDINNGINDPDGGARQKGYNELIWDGRDESGNDVANGVYFALVRGTYEGETKEKILKVARLR